MNIRPLFFLFLMTIAQVSQADVHTIDRDLADCIDRDSSTAGMVDCTNTSYEQWDNELNQQYAALMAVISAGDQQVLREAQRQWLAFRDAEFKAIDAFYSSKDGTMYLPMRAGDRLELVKARALKLAAYVSLMRD